jgi:hypothetical protein
VCESELDEIEAHRIARDYRKSKGMKPKGGNGAYTDDEAIAMYLAKCSEKMSKSTGVTPLGK